MSDGAEPLALSMPARTWATIDATIDNMVSRATVDGPQEFAEMGETIRQAGWDQVPWVGGEWPPMAKEISVSLTREQWKLAATEIEDGIPVTEQIGDQVSAQLGRDALATRRPGPPAAYRVCDRPGA